MKTIGKRLLFIILPLAIAVTPLQAQTDGETVPAPPSANPLPGVTNARADLNSSSETNTNAGIRVTHPAGQVVIDHFSPQGGPTFGEVVIFTLLLFLLPLCIVALVFYYRHRHSRMLHETLRLMIEKGVAIPPELLQPPPRFNLIRKGNDLRTGMILAGIGLGLLLIRMADNRANVGAVGFIPLFIGVAFLISWKLGPKPGQPGN